MKKYGIGSRVLTALLVLAMIVSMIPMSIWAAVGDIATGDEVGSTGLTGNINTQDTISWPIKIYDYLNDGMLFETANAGDGGDIPNSRGGAYGGGTAAPQFEGAKAVVGNDYTILGTYDERPWDTWVSSTATNREANAEVLGTQHAPTAFKEPMYAHFEYEESSDETKYPSDSGQGTKFRAWISDFYYDNETYYDKDELRYIVVVYRNNSVTNGAYVDFTFRNSSGTDFTGPSVAMPASPNKWSYFVYDMYKDGWSSIGTDNIRYVKFTFPLNAIVDGTPETIDISHIAYFGSEFEATEFGKDAVAFDNDPGEMLDSHTEYYPAGTKLPVFKPTTDSNGMDFSQYGVGGYQVDTYDTWAATPTYYSYLGNSVGGVKVAEVDNGERSYVSVSNSHNTTDRSIFLWQWSDGGKLYYVTLVYKTTGFTADEKIGFFMRDGNNGNAHSSNMATTLSGATKSATLAMSNDKWTTVTYAISSFDDGDYNSGVAYTEYGMYLPSCLTGNSGKGKSLDIAMVCLTTNQSTAKTYGQQAAAYMNGETKEVSGSYTTPQKQWNTGNNISFGMLYANQGGGWRYYTYDSYGNPYTCRGGDNDWTNGYFSYQIGASVNGSGEVYDDIRQQNDHRETAKDRGYPVSDHIFLVGQGAPFDTSKLDLGGYGLLNTFNGGVYTAGLLNPGLVTVTGTDGKTYRVPDYKEETVEYIAIVLREALRISQTDGYGNYNYNFVRGTVNGDQYGYDANGKAMDLASALRKELKVILPATCGKAGSGYAELGDYAKLTDTDKAGLIGEFKQVKDNINTFVDAAYYLLMNLYVSDSYNQTQDEYSYLVLSQGTLSNGTESTADDKSAYIFDGGFTTGNADNTANTDEYRNSSQSAIVYDKELDTISMNSALSKDQVFYEGSNETTRFPFLPVTDSTGVYAGETKSPYFLDDGRGVMGITEEGATFVNRNYNFAMASNGEFVFHYDSDLFFEFEGDDDVYLFINGELVLDIGGAHSITKVSLNVNDYVDWAKTVLANRNSGNYSAAQIARAEKLNLKDGQKYTFDFYYMERHGWGSNCRIVSNIIVTDPTLATDKQAYQGTDVNGNPIEVEYGGVVDTSLPVGYSFAITNKGETKLYKLGFEDADIGLSLTYDGGLQIYGKPTVKTVTVNGSEGITVKGLNGIVDVDGDNYMVSADGTCTWYETVVGSDGEETTEKKTAQAIPAAAGTHTVTLYMYEPDASKPVNPLFTDVKATVTTAAGTQTADVQGIYVCDQNGGNLDVSDLIITVDGYESKDNYDKGIAMDTFYIRGAKDANGNYTALTNENLKSFLTNLLDPNHQTAEEEDLTEDLAAANLYANDGLWQNATVKISGFYYKLTEAQRTENRFTNTVYTTGYKFRHGKAPLKSQDRHRVYGLGSYAYYQWANNTVHLDIKTMWDDVTSVFASPNEALYEQSEHIQILNDSITADDGTVNYNKLKVELTNNVGDPLTATYNLYSGGLWDTYSARRIYFTNADSWEDAYVYYWSDTNDHMTGWPGVKMTSDSGRWYADIPMSAQHVIFNNGTEVEESERQQTANLTLTADDNLYTGGAASGAWSVLTGVTNPDPVANRIYFNNVDDWNKDWNKVCAYYWSDTNTGMSTWPGVEMKNTASDNSGTWYIDVPNGAEYIIFNNGYSGEGNQTRDLTLPQTAYTAVKWNGTNHVLEVDFHNSGRQIFYVKVSSTDTSVINYVIVPVVFYVTNVENSNYVLDYGLATGELSDDVLKYDDFLYNYNSKDEDGWKVKAEFMGYLNKDPRYLGTFSTAALNLSNVNRVAIDGSYLSDSYVAADGTFKITGTAQTELQYSDSVYSMPDTYSLSFTPNKIMDEEYDLWMVFRVHNPTVKEWNKTDKKWTSSTFEPNVIGTVNSTTATYKIDIHNEVQMFKKITVLPATVVYYEDDFVDIQYNKTDENKANFTTEKKGNGSLDLTQGIAAETPYGQDEVYQGSANATMSGNSLTKIKINNTDKVASFGFTGTGFEIISRTNAFDSASFYITVKDASGVVVKKFPVITEFTNAGNTVCTHASHGDDGACATCGQNVSHNFVVNKANTYWLSVSKAATKLIFSDGTSQSTDIELTGAVENAEAKTTTPEGGEARTLGTYTVKQDPNNSGNWLVYFTDTSNMGRMYLYAWYVDGETTTTVTDAWPGSAMTPDSACSVCGKVGMEYYLVGYINNADYDGTNHKFVDGQVSLDLTAESYVYVQSSLGETYQTRGYDENATNAILYQNPSEANKLRVPGNTKANFTLAVNEDGTVTLSYVTEALTTSGGSEDDSDEAASTTRVYFDNTNVNWTAVNIHYWGGSSTEWPGVAMTQIEGTNIYYYDVPTDVTGLLFNYNGDANKTKDLKLSDQGNMFIGGSSRWVIYDEDTNTITDVPTTIYYDNSETQWTTVRAYYWTDANNSIVGYDTAPEMTRIGQTDIYTLTIPEHMEYVIFHNGSGAKTGDITMSAKGNIYTASGVWATYDPATGTVVGDVCKHNYVGVVTTAATCSKEGVKTYTCSECGDSYTESIDTTAHTYVGEKCTSCGAGYAIHQVPVIRVDGLTHGKYTVEINGVPTYDFSSLPEDPSKWPIDKENSTIEGLKTLDTYLYIDGIRIFQPLKDGNVVGANSHYTTAENGAIFTELRNLILDGDAAVAQYVKEKSGIYAGNLSWVENRTGEIGDNKSFVGNRVSDVNEYMLVGPNNEVYMSGNAEKQAIVFYVTEDATVSGHTLQIAARAIDSGLFFDGFTTGTEATLYQGVATNSNTGYAWKLIDTIQSGTEQYYTINYAACPYTEANGVRTYQVVLYVRGGMVSFSTVKTNGLSIDKSGISEPTTLIYEDGGRLKAIDNAPATQNIGWNFYRLSEQMNSTVFLDAGETDNDSGSGSGSDSSNDNTGSGELNPATGDMALVNVILIMLTCLAFVSVISRKKLIG